GHASADFFFEALHSARIARVDGARKAVGRRVRGGDGCVEAVDLDEVYAGAEAFFLRDAHVHLNAVENTRRAIQAAHCITREVYGLAARRNALAFEEQRRAACDPGDALLEPAFEEALIDEGAVVHTLVEWIADFECGGAARELASHRGHHTPIDDD